MRFALLTVVASLVFAASANADEIIVGFSTPDHGAAHRAVGGKVKRQIGGINADVVSVPDGQAQSYIDRYKRQPGFRYAEVDVAVQALTVDPMFSSQWHLNNSSDVDVDQPEAWTKGGFPLNVKVAVLDTGIDQNHEDLPASMDRGPQKDFTGSSSGVDDLYGHGTHVAGIIAALANNNTGVSGVAPNVQLLNGKVLGDNGSGSCSSVADGITWAADQYAAVISMSLGGGACTTEANAVAYAAGKGSLIVAAAGNSSSSAPSYPAYYEPAVAVAATDSNDKLASFSNFGSWVDIAAPGVNILSTLPNHASALKTQNYGYLSGTSMATPVVSAVAALRGGGSGIRSDLLSKVDKKGAFKPKLGSGVGRVNACRFVSAAGC